MKSEEKNITTNRKALHDFHVVERIEAGISLKGTEVKSIKEGNIVLKDGFCNIRDGELFLKNVHISHYSFGNRLNHEPMRERKLLLHKHEISKLDSKIKEKGLTLIPIRVYVKKGKIKLELGLVRGKRLYNKREDIKMRDEMRDLKRDFKLSDLTGKMK
ncbi:MAG: SsrA-binding protein SmpB [Spirochaetota bacterium]|nr:MAG: SsrA-binding protein SmpB [Spirochaetota bacterium]